MRSYQGLPSAHGLVLCVLAFLAPACPADDTTDSGDSAAATGGTPGTASADESAGLSCPNGNHGQGSGGESNDLMMTWGAPCTEDAQCVALLGDGAECRDKAVVYELHGGYCTKPCTLPDSDTRVVEDAMDCDPAGGVACIGLQGFFTACTPLCTDDMQCSREGYFCRRMPMISEEADPKACLMPDCCEGTCADG